MDLERLYPIREVPNRIPASSRGGPVSIATIVRWATKGLRGIKLETVRVGGTRCVSDAMLVRFFESISEQPSVQPQPAPSNFFDRNHSVMDMKLKSLGL